MAIKSLLLSGWTRRNTINATRTAGYLHSMILVISATAAVMVVMEMVMLVSVILVVVA